MQSVVGVMFLVAVTVSTSAALSYLSDELREKKTEVRAQKNTAGAVGNLLVSLPSETSTKESSTGISGRKEERILLNVPTSRFAPGTQSPSKISSESTKTTTRVTTARAHSSSGGLKDIFAYFTDNLGEDWVQPNYYFYGTFW